MCFLPLFFYYPLSRTICLSGSLCFILETFCRLPWSFLRQYTQLRPCQICMRWPSKGQVLTYLIWHTWLLQAVKFKKKWNITSRLQPSDLCALIKNSSTILTRLTVFFAHVSPQGTKWVRTATGAPFKTNT